MKRAEALQPLSHDHYNGLIVVRRLRQGLERSASPDVMGAYVQHVWTHHLAHHFEQEEMHLLGPLRQAGDEGRALAGQMLDEHRRIHDLVDALAGDPAPDALGTLAEAMQAHIRFEERRLFPFLEETCEEATLHAIGTHLHAQHEEADLGWTPAFWEETA